MAFSLECFSMIKINITCHTYTQNIKVVLLSMQSVTENLLAGKIPNKKHKLVVAWIEIHQEDLLADWELAVNGKKPFPIRGLDQ